MSDVGLFLLLFAALAVMLGVIRFFAWLTDFFEAGGVGGAVERSKARYLVKHSDNSSAEIMSRSPISDTPSVPSSIQTDSRQTADQTQAPTYNRAGMLDIYRLMRKYGIPREEARAALQAAALPLDNNAWTKAAPAADDTHVTPIAGRPTKAVFDADFPYEPIDA